MFDWVQSLADWVTYSMLSLSPQSHWGEALNFFIYDTLKILMLLFLITLIMGTVNSYFPIEKIRNFLSKNRMYGGEYLLASVFGAVTPFCSCSSVPLFIGFVKGGIPLGVTFSFLITSPLVNEVAVAMFVGMFGWKITLFYVGSGILLGTFGGFILGRMKLDRLLSEWVQNLLKQPGRGNEWETEELTFAQRMPAIIRESMSIIGKIFWYVIIGIGIGALMHGFIPTDFFDQYITKDNPFAVPIAVLLAVPMYSNAAGVLPIVQVLVQKGIPMGTALAFMMAVVGLSLPEAALLKKVMRIKLILIFFSIVAICIMLIGYAFNLIF